ncbi:hypothetical protein ACWGNE_17445 [Streptomyces xiamenensis]|uniref:hypothetical protein n=1 Tax=Streptomyces xiamenensis TaxID=408015 RepID=UPI0036A7C980
MGEPAALRVLARHRGLLARCQPLADGQGVPVVPAQRKVRREYETLVGTLTP